MDPIWFEIISDIVQVIVIIISGWFFFDRQNKKFEARFDKVYERLDKLEK